MSRTYIVNYSTISHPPKGERAESHAKNVERARVRGSESERERERDCCRNRVNEVFWHNWHTNLSGMTHQLTATAAAAAAAWGPWQKFNWPFFFNFCFCLVFLNHFYFHFHFALQVYHVIERPRCVYALSDNLM